MLLQFYHMDSSNEAALERFAKIAVIAIGALMILIGTLYISFRFSKTQPSGLIFPGGVTYLGQSPTPNK